MVKGNGGLLVPKHHADYLRETPDPMDPAEVPVVFRGEKPAFNLTFDLDGKTIGRFWYEDKQLKFEGDVDESAKIWIDFVISKFMEWHDEHTK